MKKICAVLVGLMMLLSLAGCGAGDIAGATDVGLAISEKNAAQDDAAQYGITEISSKKDKVKHKVIHTSLGNIRGIREDGYLVFKGVKYATAKRWEDAVPVTTRWHGVYDATEFGPASWQYRGFYGSEGNATDIFYWNEAAYHIPETFSEDCLNLNIWRPEKIKKNQEVPVLVYIHGGSFVTGSASDMSIDGAAYAENDVMLISVNYRLDAFSLIYGDGYIGNYMLTDIITAIKWIRDNIEDYGGDPDRITIMGESAGATAVQDVLISPLAEGLVSGAIMMSGGGPLSEFMTPTTPDMVEPVWTRVKEKFGVDDISELVDVDPETLYYNWLMSYVEMTDYANTALKPMVNGDSLTMNVEQAIAAGEQENVPCIIGVLSEDMYPWSLYTSALEYGIAQDQAGNEPVYTYFFDRKPPGENPFGAFHAADLYYAFGTLDRSWRPYDEIDYRVSQNMIDYISNFAKTGDPNDGCLPNWNPITSEYQMSLRFGDDEPAMYAPSLEELLNRQLTVYPFPY